MTNSIAPLFFIIPVMFVITYFLIYKICKSPISAFIYAVFIAVLLIIILQYVGFATPMPLSLGILLVVIIVFAALFLGVHIIITM